MQPTYATAEQYDHAMAFAPLNWVCTDADNYQYGHTVSSGVYEFRELLSDYWPEDPENMTEQDNAELWANSEAWNAKTITLSEYTLVQREEYARTYYSGLAELYGAVDEPSATDMENGHFLLAECIFEQTAPYFA